MLLAPNAPRRAEEHSDPRRLKEGVRLPQAGVLIRRRTNCGCPLDLDLSSNPGDWDLRRCLLEQPGLFWNLAAYADVPSRCTALAEPHRFRTPT
jgi:hypothetical protein